MVALDFHTLDFELVLQVCKHPVLRRVFFLALRSVPLLHLLLLDRQTASHHLDVKHALLSVIVLQAGQLRFGVIPDFWLRFHGFGVLSFRFGFLGRWRCQEEN